MQDGRKPYLVYLIAMVAAVGGFLFGYDLSIISGVISPRISAEPVWSGIAIASALVGCMAGPILGGSLCDRWGRKVTLIFAGVLFALGAFGIGAAGINLGIRLLSLSGGRRRGPGVGGVAHVHRRDVAAAHSRGLVTINQLAIVIGLTCARSLRTGCRSASHWRWMLASNAVPVPSCGRPVAGPGKPALDGEKNRHREAMDVLTLIEGGEMRSGNAGHLPSLQTREVAGVVRPGMRFALLIACGLAIFQQITGASILTMYIPTVFQKAGFLTKATPFPEHDGRRVVRWSARSLPSTVDRVGESRSWCWARWGWSSEWPSWATSFTCTRPAHASSRSPCHRRLSLSVAPMAWLIMSEIFPNRLRGKAMAVASVCVWTAAS